MKPAKTAGTSILRGILEVHFQDIIHKKDHPKKLLRWIKNLSEKILDGYFIFSVCRNPWDRVVSIAHYFDISLADFLGNYDKHMDNWQIKAHSHPISIYTHYHNSQFVDKVCRFENLDYDKRAVFAKLGLNNIQIPNRNKTEHDHCSHYFDLESKDIVSMMYNQDVTNFGYQFEREIK